MPEEIVLGGVALFLAYVISELFFESICYRVGYFLARIVTFSKWPKFYGEYERSLGFLGLLVILSPFLPFMF